MTTTLDTKRILTIEDDSAIRRGIVDALRFAGYDVYQSGHGEGVVEAVTGSNIDLVLLDIVLPGADGFEIMKRLRAARPSVRVILLTARGDENDRVRGLRGGADDYVVKPFSVRELLARVEAVLRRGHSEGYAQNDWRFPGGRADFRRREIRFEDGSRRELSERESELLQYLSSNPGRAVDRRELLANVWRISPEGLTTRTIDMLVARLREKLRDDADNARILLTVRGTGYMCALPDPGLESKAHCAAFN